ncbi:hypothetical protein ACNJRW_09540 [Stenotrophomonas maltophilia]|uniref:Uncharacterized protein n=1 Tax=Stenotrophomonas maltophilia TaxID=40324 RepID=A0AB34TDD8_STEMA|nr:MULTISPECIES: hypothetical protein [Stenotrophomonas]KOO75336.1 hypothetical protein VL23_17480 [Stenotrophomonas maltophilia]MDZ7473558.1 hypothetical protein [Stenotrophomonas pavanii]
MDDKARIERLEREAVAHRQELDILIGRLNAVHGVLFQMLADRENSAEVLTANLAAANERIAADLLQSPLPETTVAEHQRVAGELLAVANNVRLGLQKP